MNRANSDGYCGQCKECRIAYNKGYREKNAERRRVYQREYVKLNPERSRETQRKFKTPEYNRAANLRSKYGISVEEYETLLQQQEGLCACCETDLGNERKPGFVDHCHSTGKIRGLLCNRCNVGIGMLGDTIEGVRRALRYLESS